MTDERAERLEIAIGLLARPLGKFEDSPRITPTPAEAMKIIREITKEDRFCLTSCIDWVLAYRAQEKSGE